MVITAYEQFMIELVNRARLDPVGEAELLGVELNRGLSARRITAQSYQPLAVNDQLAQASDSHSRWMLRSESVSHRGAAGSDAGDRIAASGYDLSGSATWSENVAFRGSSGRLNREDAILKQHVNLFESAAHRLNMFKTDMAEIGVGQAIGRFSGYNASLVTQNFAVQGNRVFLTGVAYADRDGDDFYSIGEGRRGVLVHSGTDRDTTAAAGGYAIETAGHGPQMVTAWLGPRKIMVEVMFRGQNVKLDIVGNREVETSASARLVRGVRDAELLGVNDLNLTGTAMGNRLTGNEGDNILKGMAGNDILQGGAGKDRMFGGAGQDTADYSTAADGIWVHLSRGMGRFSDAQGDRLFSIENVIGSDHDDRLIGNAKANRLTGNAGDDTLDGGSGRDRLMGQGGNDVLVGSQGADRMDGGGGFDWVTYATSQRPVFVDLSTNGPQRGGFAAGDILLRVEAVEGSRFDDRLTGDAGANVLAGGAGADFLDGGAGNDRLIGGAGADVFVFRAGGGTDTITDFTPGADRLRIDAAALGDSAPEDRISLGEEGIILSLSGGGGIVLEGVTAIDAVLASIDLF